MMTVLSTAVANLELIIMIVLTVICNLSGNICNVRCLFLIIENDSEFDHSLQK
jgi:hypothetical protein